MKVRFKKKGLIFVQYSVVEHCCDRYKHLTEVLWDDKNSEFYFPAQYVSIYFNYCGYCGSKTEVVDENGVPQPLPSEWAS